MKAIVCDTSPLNYLVQLGKAHLLPELYSPVVIPLEVLTELRHPGAPATVRDWATHPSVWLRERRVEKYLALPADEGETAALSLAVEAGIETVLIDDARGRSLALQLKLNPIGTLRLLELAWEKRLSDLNEDLDKLQSLNFRVHPQLIATLRAKTRKG
jgi:predicted nucleic acid-binding protein